MPVDYRSAYPADDVERRIPATWAPAPDGNADERGLAERVGRACARVGVDREVVVQAVRVAIVRLARRHGSLAPQPLAYHNESHLLELLEDKLPRLIAASALPPSARGALALFCACHDLRQREDGRAPEASVGANEAASLAETERLLDDLGLDERALRWALRLAIIGSTFAAGTDEGDRPQGAFAHGLAAWLDGRQPGWRDDAALRSAEHLARVAADLDTSNVASSYVDFAQSAIALALEIQDGAGRELDSAEAGASCLAFLTDGQERYVFELQRFASPEGRAAFAAQREANAARVRDTARRMRERFGGGSPPASGHEVIAAFRAMAALSQ